MWPISCGVVLLSGEVSIVWGCTTAHNTPTRGATVNGGNGNGNGNGNGKGSSKLQATIVVQLKMEEMYGWYGP